MRLPMLLCLALALRVEAHDAHGRSNAPAEARRLKSPAKPSEESLAAARAQYDKLCANCHGEDGRARTKAAGAMKIRPTDLTNYLMESMKDGEIYWVVANGIEQRMPAFGKTLEESERWAMAVCERERTCSKSSRARSR